MVRLKWNGGLNFIRMKQEEEKQLSNHNVEQHRNCFEKKMLMIVKCVNVLQPQNGIK